MIPVFFRAINVVQNVLYPVSICQMLSVSATNVKSKFCRQPHLADNSAGRQARKQPADSDSESNSNSITLLVI